ncbi:MAG: hydrogenase iron-sulfur subunit [bacterium]|nr:hydrogenase iron-sulfur subunit [bacterium]
MNNSDFEPRIVVFACNWCSYAGADTAGVSRLQHSPKFRVIRTMCSGRVNSVHILKAFEMGADGVLVSGCHIGDCHYMFGNHWAIKQFDVTRDLLNMLGLEEARTRLEWVSAAEGPKWASLIDEFVTTIQQLGPSPLRGESTEESFGDREIDMEVNG